MVTHKAAAAVALVESGAPLWAQRMALKLQAYFMPMTSDGPMPVWPVTKANLPPASDWPNSFVLVTDQNELAVSLGGQWLKIVTGGPV